MPTVAADKTNGGVDFVPWVEKYRPKILDDVYGHQQNIATLRNQMRLGILPHMLFHGPPGTGKTSTIIAVANELYGEKRPIMVLELNASDDRGLGVVRENIKTFCQQKYLNFQVAHGKQDMDVDGAEKSTLPSFKLVILDECDAMSKDAQNAMRRILEQYVMNTRFCLICNNLSKIIPALQSRCMRLRYGPLPEEFLVNRVKQICDMEEIGYNGAGLKAVVTLSEGDMRGCVNIINQIAMREDGMIDEDTVHRCCGRPLPAEIHQVFEILMNKPILEARTHLTELMEKRGFSLTVVIKALLPMVMGIQSKKNSGKKYLAKSLAAIEYRLAKSTDESACLDELIAEFYTARDIFVQDNT
eukprot:TRINITY_DN8030_c0_g1_i2.p1 TRINITY_DN8030_c0_g1~~TRINITY_DN8030_c0_g1_i2.p1  ORF type:complete len:358 (-),score=37.98 TRINITY_DN8030_c0_g1_i2:360-1433(-)